MCYFTHRILVAKWTKTVFYPFCQIFNIHVISKNVFCAKSSTSSQENQSQLNSLRGQQWNIYNSKEHKSSNTPFLLAVTTLTFEIIKSKSKTDSGEGLQDLLVPFQTATKERHDFRQLLEITTGIIPSSFKRARFVFS